MKRKALLAALVMFFAIRILASAQINPLIPMTAITGKPTRQDIRAMLCRYKEVGIEQFLIYPRSGLEIEYMSDEWMEFCRNCLEIADSLGMRVWLYDEYNWPSGNCKGAVTAGEYGRCYPKLLMFNNDGNGNYSVELTHNELGADLLDPEAVGRFIALTHQRYYDEFKEYFGRVIPAIFTDEPSFSYSTSSAKGLLEANFTGFDNDHFPLTWYPGLEEDYKAACGGDLRQDVIAHLKGKPSGELWTNYYTLVGDRMRKTYLQTLSSWCESHGIHLTGHLMYEKLYKSVRCNGNALKALSVFGLPGFDEANSDIALSAKEMEISGLSLAQYAGRGKDGEICEMYSVGPADNTMSHMRQLLWMCAAFGVNNYIVAVAAMDARGNKEKGDWYFPSGPTQPWYDYYREFGYEASKAATFARKGYTPNVMVRVPSRYFMSLDKTPAFESQGVKYLRFLEHLLAWQIQYHLLDEDETAPENTIVLGFGENGFYIEGEDQRYDDLDCYFKRITTAMPRDLVVRDLSGMEVRDVLVRLWDDNTVTLVDLTDDDMLDRILDVELKGIHGKVRLQGHGAFAGGISDMDAGGYHKCFTPSFSNAEMRLCGSNLARCLYTKDKPQFAFKAKHKIKGMRLIVRSEVDHAEIMLDGKPITAARTSDRRLPEGFRQLYEATDEFTLGKGEHVMTVSNDVTDFRYLPSVFLEGEFTYSRKAKSIDRWNGKGHLTSEDCIPDYVGTYEIISNEYLPSEPGTAIRLNTNLACTELLIDGKSLGRKAWGPYEWEIPESCLGGRHEITVRISNSIMPMFGDIKALDEDQPYASWLRIKPGMHGNKSVTGVFHDRAD